MLLAVVGVSLAGVGGQGIWRRAPLAQAGAFQLQAVGAVDDAIQNGVSQGHVTEHFDLPLTSSGSSHASP